MQKATRLITESGKVTLSHCNKLSQDLYVFCLMIYIEIPKTKKYLKQWITHTYLTHMRLNRTMFI